MKTIFQIFKWISFFLLFLILRVSSDVRGNEHLGFFDQEQDLVTFEGLMTP